MEMTKHDEEYIKSILTAAYNLRNTNVPSFESKNHNYVKSKEQDWVEKIYGTRNLDKAHIDWQKLLALGYVSDKTRYIKPTLTAEGCWFIGVNYFD